MSIYSGHKVNVTIRPRVALQMATINIATISASVLSRAPSGLSYMHVVPVNVHQEDMLTDIGHHQV